MGITIGNLSFEGPFAASSQLQSRSGVYAILGRGAGVGDWIVVDIGESGDVKDRVENHDRKVQWQARGHAMLNVAAFYCDPAARMKIEKQLRQRYNPVCGDR
jgi:hypothetical protein